MHRLNAHLLKSRALAIRTGRTQATETATRGTSSSGEASGRASTTEGHPIISESSGEASGRYTTSKEDTEDDFELPFIHGGVIKKVNVTATFGFNCYVCKHKFLDFEEMEAHKETHKVVCGNCGQEISSRKCLKVHCKRIHGFV